MVLLHRLFPELARFDNRGQKVEAWDNAIRGMYRRWRFWVVLAAIAVVYVIVIVEIVDRLGPALIRWSWVLSFIPFLIAASLFRRSIQASLRRQLLAMGKPICLKCGYDLTGNTSGICPECGELTPRNE